MWRYIIGDCGKLQTFYYNTAN